MSKSKHTENIHNEARGMFARWRHDGQPVEYSSERMDELLDKPEDVLWVPLKEDEYDGLVAKMSKSKHTENIHNEARGMFARWRHGGQPVEYSSERMDELLDKPEDVLWVLLKEDECDGLVAAADAVGYMVYNLALCPPRAFEVYPPAGLFISERLDGSALVGMFKQLELHNMVRTATTRIRELDRLRLRDRLLLAKLAMEAMDTPSDFFSPPPFLKSHHDNISN